MGRKGNWLSSVKKALSPETKGKKGQVCRNSCVIISVVWNLYNFKWFLDILFFQGADKYKKKWFGKHKYPDPNTSSLEAVPDSSLAPPEEVKIIEPDNEQHKHAYSVSAEPTPPMAPLDVPETDVEVAEITTITQSTGIAKEEAAAIKIQTTFRGYLVCTSLNLLFIKASFVWIIIISLLKPHILQHSRLFGKLLH